MWFYRFQHIPMEEKDTAIMQIDSIAVDGLTGHSLPSYWPSSTGSTRKVSARHKGLVHYMKYHKA